MAEISGTSVLFWEKNVSSSFLSGKLIVVAKIASYFASVLNVAVMADAGCSQTGTAAILKNNMTSNKTTQLSSRTMIHQNMTRRNV